MRELPGGAGRPPACRCARCIAVGDLAPVQRRRVKMGAHAGAQLGQRITQAALGRLEADVECARDLVERDAVFVVQQERGLLRHRQLLQALEQLGTGTAPEHHLVDRIFRARPGRPRRPFGHERLDVVALGQRHLATRAPQHVDRAVVRQREQPGAKGRTLRHVSILGVDHAQPRVLEHLVGLRSAIAPEQPAHESVQRAVVPPVQPLEGLHIAGRERRHQRHIVIVGVHHPRRRVVVHRLKSAMSRRPHRSRTGIERTQGANGVGGLSANASEPAARRSRHGVGIAPRITCRMSAP